MYLHFRSANEPSKNHDILVGIMFGSLRLGFLHIFFSFGFDLVLGKTRVIVRFVLAGFGFFPISRKNPDFLLSFLLFLLGVLPRYRDSFRVLCKYRKFAFGSVSVLIFIVSSSIRFGSIKVRMFDCSNFSSVTARTFSTKLLQKQVSACE